VNVTIFAVCQSSECGRKTFSERVLEPTAKKLSVVRGQRQIWMDTHYEMTGHHRFDIGTDERDECSVAKIPNPDQLRLRDDPDNAHLDPSNWNMKEPTDG
jgi:hypothetical protein